MANIEHPRLVAESPFETLEQNFVEESFEGLFLYSVLEEVRFVDGYKISYAVTDRCDIETEEGYCALRLRAIPQVIGEDMYDFRVVMLEYFNFTEEWMADNEPVADSDITWVPYVLAVSEDSINEDEEPESKVTVLSASKGEPLTTGDLIEASSVLRQLRASLVSKCFVEDAEQFSNGFSIRKSVKYSDTFEPSNFIDGNECGMCLTGYTHCLHEENIGSLN